MAEVLQNIVESAPAPVQEVISNGHVKPTATKASNMVDLAAIISKQTAILDKYLIASGSSAPGFDFDSPANFPKLPSEIKKAREELVRASKELTDLVTGPTESVRWMAWDVSFLKGIFDTYVKLLISYTA